jgi:3-hydroxyisobutyrate dehydrogenase-like beta-hydroxyacid dehydrogenase
LVDAVTSVALLGTGRMGGAMVGTLRRSGFDVVTWNRDRD